MLVVWLKLVVLLAAVVVVVVVVQLVFCLVNDFFHLVRVESVNRVEPYCRNWLLHTFVHVNCLESLVSNNFQVFRRHHPLCYRNESVAFLS